MDNEETSYHFLTPLATPTRGNVTVFVTDMLRQAIVTLQLKPGEVIDKNALCDRLGVSRFPVSEALARLQAEGLVDILPQRGTTVSLDAATLKKIRSYSIPGGPDDIAFAPDGKLWITRRFAEKVAVLDPATGTFETISVGRSPHGLFLNPHAPTTTHPQPLS